MDRMREWTDADTYHRVSDPQYRWGVALLDRLSLRGDELAVDVGCGTGRLTAALASRLPRGRVIATDLSSNMVTVAKRELARSHPRFYAVQADASRLPLNGRADLVFSTATFHWVLDHPALFRSIHTALAPGGRLFAQCGGGPNIKRLHDRAAALMHETPFAPHFADWTDPWEFADAETTAERLCDAEFVDVRTNLEESPVILPDAAAFSTFLTNVVCRVHIARLPSESLRTSFVDRLTEMAGGDRPAYLLDYWRLNMEGVKR